MKLKKLITMLCIAAVVTVGVLSPNTYNKNPQFSEMTLSNVEAVASGETNNGKGSAEVRECGLPYIWFGVFMRRCYTTVVVCVGDSEDDCTGRSCTDSHI